MTDQLKKVKRSQGNNHKFSLLIPSWNNLEYLQLCIGSIRKNSHFSHQIVVVINEGTDGTKSWVESQPDIDYVYSPTNMGICYGLNSCRLLIETGYIVYINDDMYLLPGWDKTLDEVISGIGHQQFILSATLIEPSDTGNSCVVVRNFGHDIGSFDEAKLLQEYNKLEKPDWNGSTWPPNIIPTELWDLVGGMSIEFSPGMYSDPDLSMKLWQAGVRYFRGVGKSKVYHFGSRSTRRLKQNKGSDQFLMKWGMTSRTFVTYFLKRGKPFEGELAAPEIGFATKWKNKFKRLIRC
jgi:GT2 family glycosyltransferase